MSQNLSHRTESDSFLDSESAQNSEMWHQIMRMPFDLLEKASDFVYINKVMSLAARYHFSLDDPHMADPQYTTKLGRLFLLVSSKCRTHISHIEEENKRISRDAKNIEEFLNAKIAKQNADLVELREISQSARPIVHSEKVTTASAEHLNDITSESDRDVKRLKPSNDDFFFELRSMKRTNNELSQSLQARQDELESIRRDYEKQNLEYTHLVSRYRRLMEKFKISEEMLEEYSTREKQKKRGENNELERLREKNKSLQQENYALIESRDRAEELCERRESEAFQDMSELRRLTKDLIDEERSKQQQAAESYAAWKQEHMDVLNKLTTQHEENLRAKDEEIAALRRQLEKVPGRVIKHLGDTSVLTESASRTTESTEGSLVPDDKRRRLERENDNLVAAVEELELRLDAMEEEKQRLTRLVKDYESGDEGLSHLRHQLMDHARTVEFLQAENTQLQERLSATEDSLVFTAALQELCRRVGVTEDEINSLRPRNGTAYSEMSTLKEELNVLKEELEWLEKDRRHWMNKVRLQPLMDTKLRFELGLTPEQLKQLDGLVDQMKSGHVLVEDADISYKERYFKELQARRKDAEQFSEYVKERIDDALRHAFSSLDGPDVAESAWSTLKDRITAIATTGGGVDVEGLTTPRQLQESLQSANRRIAELELSANDNESTIKMLREKLVAAIAEKEAVSKERDHYSSILLAAADLPLVNDGEAGAALNVFASDKGGEAGGGGGPSSRFTSEFLARSPQWAAASATTVLQKQLKAKDDFIETLSRKLRDALERVDEARRVVADEKQASELARLVEADLRDQIAALQELNEDLSGRNNELMKINAEVSDAMSRLPDTSARELLQKIVLLRRREAKLCGRLRRALSAQEESAAVSKQMQASMDTIFKHLQEALQGSSTGFVLPSSSAHHAYEEAQLGLLHLSLQNLLQGRLYREDSRYLLHLQQVYENMEIYQEARALRLKGQENMKVIETLQVEIDQLRQQTGPRLGSTVGLDPCEDGVADGRAKEYTSAAVSKWETECTTWRQKYELSYKRLVAKQEEVSILEKELDATRQEMVQVKDHIRNLLHPDAPELSLSPPPLPERAIGTTAGNGDAQTAEDAAPAAADSDGGLFPSRLEKGGAGARETSFTADSTDLLQRSMRLERDVARLKSVNLGLLQHSLDLQSSIKSLEIELESARQETALLKDGSNTAVISDFVSAAIREHAALQRQSELALLQVKRLKIQLAATEANYQIVANEATTYKLSAYRLYRRYVEETVAAVDYIRHLQRASQGSVSVHRTEIMDQRLRLALQELEGAFKENKALAVQLSDQSNAVKALEQQLSLLKLSGEAERSDAFDVKLREARAATREGARQLTECKENCRFSEAKAQRMEAYVKQLTDEITRLEQASWNMSPLDEAFFEKLLHLRDTVFAKAESPPLAIQSIESTSPRGGLSGRTDSGALGREDSDVAIREYKTAVLKQKELTRECATLREELEAGSRQVQRLATTTEDLQEHIRRLEEKAALYQSQLECERAKAGAREAQLRKVHEAQAEVARRALEHNCQCLRDVLQHKETEIAQLQKQLHVERQKYAELQLEEASRMERLYEKLFRDNDAVLERLKSAVRDETGLHGVASQSLVASPAGDSAVLEQLHYLTAETTRLKNELQSARTTNTLLEAQLGQQVHELRAAASVPPFEASPQTAVLPTLGAGGGGLPGLVPSSPQPTACFLPDIFSGEGPSASASIKGTDALRDIINSQGAMIESLRQREAALTSELQLEKQQHSKAEAALRTLQTHQIEQEGALRLVSAVSATASDSALVRELRSQIAYFEQELRDSKAALDQERGVVQQLRLGAEEWKRHLESLHVEVAHQQVELERSQHLAALNQSLQCDLNMVKEHNDKLITAATLLRQKLMEEARKGGESARQHQQELALTQRMGTIQQECAEQMRILDHRAQTIQRELNERVAKEKEAVTKSEETQRVVFQLHQELRRREKEVADLRHELQRLQAGESRRPLSLSNDTLSRKRQSTQSVANKGTQVLVSTAETTILPDAREVELPLPAIAATVAVGETPTAAHVLQLKRPASAALPPSQSAVSAIAQEARRMQHDNLQHTSQLRSQLARAEKNADDLKEQLKGEKEAGRALRQQVQALKKELEESEGKRAREVAQLRSSLTHSKLPRRLTPETASASDHFEKLQRRVAELEPLALAAEQYKAEINELRSWIQGRLLPQTVDASASSSIIAVSVPFASRETTQATQQESTVDQLRRQIQLVMPARENTLHHRITELSAAMKRLVHKLAEVTGLSVEEVHRAYSVPASDPEKSVAELQSELLAKNNTILDLRFTQESLQLQVDRLQRKLGQEAAADAATRAIDMGESLQKQKQRAQRGQLEMMAATIENLKLIIGRLESENSDLRLKIMHSSKHVGATTELKHLRERERVLEERLVKLSNAANATASLAGAAVHEEGQNKLHQRLLTAQAEANDYQMRLEALREQMETQPEPLPGAHSVRDAATVAFSSQSLAHIIATPVGPSHFTRFPTTNSNTEVDRSSVTGTMERAEIPSTSLPGDVPSFPPPLQPAPVISTQNSGRATDVRHCTMRHHRLRR